MVLIDVVSCGNSTSYIFKAEETLYLAALQALSLHFIACKSVGKIVKVTRL